MNTDAGSHGMGMAFDGIVAGKIPDCMIRIDQLLTQFIAKGFDVSTRDAVQIEDPLSLTEFAKDANAQFLVLLRLRLTTAR